MLKLCNQLYLLLASLFLLMSVNAYSEDVGPNDLQGEDLEMFVEFREHFQYSEPDKFFSFAKNYEEALKKKGYMMLYYKLLSNEGFYALHHNMLMSAMQTARRLDSELREVKAEDYYYLATGLLGDVYRSCHNKKKAERYFLQALEEVGDRDPKFSMRCYQYLSEMEILRNPDKAMEWVNKSLQLARQTDNVEYESLSLAMIGYIHFMNGHKQEFQKVFEDYQELRLSGRPGFSHRHDVVMDAAEMAFDGNYKGASEQLRTGGTVYVDSSLVAIRIMAMEKDIEGGFAALKRRYLEVDSIYSIVQDASFDEMSSELSLVKSREESETNRLLARKLTYWLIGLTVVYIFVYFMGRRRLWLKIQARSRDLKVALEKSEESDRMKTAFIRSMSHEIRTPLNAVAGFSQLLCTPDMELNDEEKADMQHRIKENVDQITVIVNELLELSKSESEMALSEMDKENLMCNTLCRSVMEALRDKTPTGVELRFTTTLPDDYILHTNAARLKRALGHLISNAQKFTDTGHIEVHCEPRDRHHVCISISDTGIGIDAKDSERIFENFSKVDDFKEGVGLGLPICRHLIRSLGGEVVLDTSYARGSRFVITLPVAI